MSVYYKVYSFPLQINCLHQKLSIIVDLLTRAKQMEDLKKKMDI